MNFLKRTKKWSRDKLISIKDRVVFMLVVFAVALILCIGVLAAIISAPFTMTIMAMACLITYLIEHE